MNAYSLSGESRRWWWPSATAGVAAAAAIGTIAMVPAGTHALPSETPSDGWVVLERVAHDTDPTRSRPCFMIRPRWNTALDGPQPLCGTPGADARQAQLSHGAASGAHVRRGLDTGA